MTLNYNLMYWFTRLDNLHDFFGLTGILVGVVLTFFIAVGCVAFASSSYDKDSENVYKMAKKLCKILFFPWLFAILGLIFVPTSKEMAMIYVVPNIAESQVIKQDIPEVYDLGINALKDWLKKNKEQ